MAGRAVCGRLKRIRRRVACVRCDCVTETRLVPALDGPVSLCFECAVVVLEYWRAFAHSLVEGSDVESSRIRGGLLNIVINARRACRRTHQ